MRLFLLMLLAVAGFSLSAREGVPEEERPGAGGFSKTEGFVWNGETVRCTAERLPDASTHFRTDIRFPLSVSRFRMVSGRERMRRTDPGPLRFRGAGDPCCGRPRCRRLVERQVRSRCRRRHAGPPAGRVAAGSVRHPFPCSGSADPLHLLPCGRGKNHLDPLRSNAF